MVRAGVTGNNTDFNQFVWGVLGYRYKGQDRKPIWLNYGTSNGVPAFNMIDKAEKEFGKPAASALAQELAAALEKATNEVAGGRNPGYGK